MVKLTAIQALEQLVPKAQELKYRYKEIFKKLEVSKK